MMALMMCAFTWGFLLCYMTLYMPLDRKYQALRREMMEGVKQSMVVLKGFLKDLDNMGPQISPIQIKKEE